MTMTTIPVLLQHAHSRGEEIWETRTCQNHPISAVGGLVDGDWPGLAVT